MLNLPETNPKLYELFKKGRHTVHRSEKSWNGIPCDLTIEQTKNRSAKTQGGLINRGWGEAAMKTWVLSMSTTAYVHDIMVQLTGTQAVTRDEHVELTKCRVSKDNEDLQKMIEFFKVRNPFTIESPHLHSLSHGLVSKTGEDEISCDRAEILGEKIQRKFDNLPYDKCLIKQNDVARSLASLNVIKKGKPSTSSTDNFVYFVRSVAASERLASLESAFDYELTPHPMALFKNGMMRKANKAALLQELVHKDSMLPLEDANMCNKYIVDGGALLQNVQWSKGTSFKDISKKYISFILCKYKNPTVVFDGYSIPSTKDHEHHRRSPLPLSRFISISEETKIPYSQENYFTFKENKSELVKYLSTNFRKAGIDVIQCEADADCRIAKTVLLHATRNEGPVAAVFEDTDVSVMLLHHWKEGMADIFVVQRSSTRVWSVAMNQGHIAPLKQHLLFLHSFSGCDTTSAIHFKGKVKVLKTLEKSSSFRQHSQAMSDVNSSAKQVGDASIEAFKLLYGVYDELPLSKIRYNMYMEMTCKGVISPEMLPPTASAARFHGLRVHHQIVAWSLDDSVQCNPTDWGWDFVNNSFTPIMTDRDAAPAEIKKIVRCKCKADRDNLCNSRTCSCRKHGLKCSSLCWGCRGEHCSNSNVVKIQETKTKDLETLFESSDDDDELLSSLQSRLLCSNDDSEIMTIKEL